MKECKKYSVSIPHFYCMEYCEGNRKMIIEMDFRESFYILSKKLLTCWEPPYQDEIIGDDDINRILENLQEFLAERTLPSNVYII